MAAATPGGTIDEAEVARFERIARTWWDPNGAMKTLHRFNPVRIQYIRDHVAEHFGRDARDGRPLEGLSVLDVGCGGGLLCEPLARLGATVTGIDPAPTNVEVARLHADASGAPVTYRRATVEALVAEGARFDVVLAMEVVEHVADVRMFAEACCAAVKPEGMLFMATLNRTLRAFALAIVGAEYVLGWLPKGTHQWEKFVTPDELADALAGGGFRISDETGVVYNPLTGSWRAASDMSVNYMVAATRAQRPSARA
ncbi:bifunctional 3-demethylubiquinol 3-O-methyltransferase/2-polyprenyl-6-hydroxyphenol methylase [Alsobacter soli]|uniref:Ubiquinone biosynthesis O-methyltransferase n=1 Tax=Alsobacter soli TaxID=2109933 RepID=A0A2T1HWH6_9HYPH|nr:bifunctional 2-polyprenyl-6-hydroxyphenol methylase/3-demethylubiquinol 3-O-methyltransferase UbiG [Alsobacter soli]PSC06031.1 bifunctional 3-demethylubiquinol 3-O-methyltransferase/2-polyprenyl-6-hydroxyphenol methylase [Alsobacter soli]